MSSPPTDGAPQPARVLIVEDDPLVADAFKIVLESSGYRVESAHTVREAARRLSEETPDAVLLDLTLPDGVGLEALAAAPRRPRVAVALTGHDDLATRERCLAAGCRDVLVKPVSMRELLERMRGWLAEPPAGA